MTPDDDLDWDAGGTPLSRRYRDPFFSREDGLAEARHVFLDGNGLPARFRPGFHIAELGFGTGLNFLAAWMAWESAGHPGPLRFTSFEIAPMAPRDRARALARWPELAPFLARLGAAGPGRHDLGSAVLTVIAGDVRETLPRWPGRADAWFLDGFSPARNPEMWTPALLAEVARHTRPGGSFATYSAAGHVRRALAAAGFAVSRRRGFGRKREMCLGALPGDPPVA
ncbi:MAG: FAD-dependent oxidoreductase [Paracoccaceae bacterium]|nr:MAG: FAD-dependent oxidoreductase [Paracoccaceae bacterium]